MDDEFTALAYAQSVRQARAQVLLMTFVLAYLAALLWVWAVLADTLTVLFVGLSAVWLVITMASYLSPSVAVNGTCPTEPAGRALVHRAPHPGAARPVRQRPPGEALWLAGNVVGFPHYPVLAPATLTPDPPATH